MKIKVYKTEEEGGTVIVDINNKLHAGGWQYDGDRIALDALDAEAFGILNKYRKEIEAKIRSL